MSISLRSWNADDWEDVGCGQPDKIYALLLHLVVVGIRAFSRLHHWWCGPDKLYYEVNNVLRKEKYNTTFFPPLV